jgi:hypothetical protein
MVLRILPFLLPVVEARVVAELTVDNWERLVEKRQEPSFVYFSALWCGAPCKQLAPEWKQVERKFESYSSGLLVGSVDCSDVSPSSRKKKDYNALCNRFGANVLPVLMFFYPGSKTGTVYDGKKTAGAMLQFAAELSSSCSLADQTECTDMQKMMLEEYNGFSSSRLREDSSAIANEAEAARNYLAGMQSQKEHAKGGVDRSKKKEVARVLEGQLEAASKRLEKSWERSADYRAMQLVLRAREGGAGDNANAWSQVHELPADDDEIASSSDYPADPELVMRRQRIRKSKAEALKADKEAEARRRLKEAQSRPRRPKEELHEGACVDGGPWPCTEEGCPHPTVYCKHLKGDCKRKFADVFGEPPEGLAETRVWKQCPKTCVRCTGSDPHLSGASKKEEL